MLSSLFYNIWFREQSGPKVTGLISSGARVQFKLFNAKVLVLCSIQHCLHFILRLIKEKQPKPKPKTQVWEGSSAVKSPKEPKLNSKHPQGERQPSTIPGPGSHIPFSPPGYQAKHMLAKHPHT